MGSTSDATPAVQEADSAAAMAQAEDMPGGAEAPKVPHLPSDLLQVGGYWTPDQALTGSDFERPRPDSWSPYLHAYWAGAGQSDGCRVCN